MINWSSYLRQHLIVHLPIEMSNVAKWVVIPNISINLAPESLSTKRLLRDDTNVMLYIKVKALHTCNIATYR